MTDTAPFGPLAGLKVLDIATIIAAPFAASLLADFGAEVTKFEMPGQGDGLRNFPPFRDDKPLWWKVTNRGKRYGTLDLRRPEGLEIMKKMIAEHDVLVENFRPGTLAKWGLDRDTLWAINPKLVILRVSAFGQTGPKASQGGFARIFEAMGGLTYITGMPDSAPVHPGYPIADAFGGVFGAFSILAALFGILKNGTEGEEIDLALTEATFRLLENLAIEYDQLGQIRERDGNNNQYTAPANVFRTSDGRYVTVTGSTDNMYRANMRAIGRDDLIDDPRFAGNRNRLAHRDELDAIFADYMSTHTLDETLADFQREGGAIGPIYSAEQIFNDPQVQARDVVTAVKDDDFGTVRMQNVVPRLTRNPGQIRWSAKDLGADTDAILGDLGFDATQIATLRENGII
ncbi:Crotonobetainyl-CoA:carnitine CoA-transferase CaiB [Pseudooceanicola nitratireducens]|jgi:crotonobetainyl-CoA:carnitine CoA-transferase CaiB-like acyl-CoA transferase|uniref:Crotonobetainyl-CoA:carnitine CoA-transferase CaiB n=1 Tax=Pseudooceanicola nitratireducens TaxID=517719 RepID=A0A1I1NL98_9RHOB|nr:CaiB/BaiF CoA-transferase family protein [Pseudooceanicola nitratireducens]SEI68300.1 Crotonobetainyl-CoA:carnitine CoA-transferase CaiB [Pseudooceanicola nitratireducens]SFC98297.1 Crotonobetainyl-CoA:carnitine CoA-transferase CaiB [Pseudooceanicola nitratireducens]